MTDSSKGIGKSGINHTFLCFVKCKIDLLDCAWTNYIGAPWILEEWLDKNAPHGVKKLNLEKINIFKLKNIRSLQSPYIFSDN